MWIYHTADDYINIVIIFIVIIIIIIIISSSSSSSSNSSIAFAYKEERLLCDEMTMITLTQWLGRAALQ